MTNAWDMSGNGDGGSALPRSKAGRCRIDDL